MYFACSALLLRSFISSARQRRRRKTDRNVRLWRCCGEWQVAVDWRGYLLQAGTLHSGLSKSLKQCVGHCLSPNSFEFVHLDILWSILLYWVRGNIETPGFAWNRRQLFHLAWHRCVGRRWAGRPRIHSLLADEDRETDKPAMNDHMIWRNLNVSCAGATSHCPFVEKQKRTGFKAGECPVRKAKTEQVKLWELPGFGKQFSRCADSCWQSFSKFSLAWIHPIHLQILCRCCRLIFCNLSLPNSNYCTRLRNLWLRFDHKCQFSEEYRET